MTIGSLVPVARRGIAAGLVGAITLDAYLLAVLVFATHRTGVIPFYQYVASGIEGRAAYADPNTAYLGAALHVVVAVAWGIGYAYLADRTPQLDRRPLLSGIMFGFVVMVAMQMIEVFGNIYVRPHSFDLANAFVAHALFFGIPVALVCARLDRGTAAVRA